MNKGEIVVTGTSSQAVFTLFICKSDQHRSGAVLWDEFTIAPNPVTSSAMIYFNLPYKANIQLELFDCRGSLIQEIAEGDFDAGDHEIRIGGQALSGLYLLRLKTGMGIFTRKIFFYK